uniref:Uncharacterized protein n=1 Tax=Kalanchoe fedtschenkoi TaxID=63787 RepID=A0A7N1A0P6_KALFE
MIPSSLVSSVSASVRENPEIEILEISGRGMDRLLAERFGRLPKPFARWLIT